MLRRPTAALSAAALLLVLTLPQPAASEPPGAFDLLAKVRQTYAGLASYRDRGEIEILVSRDGLDWAVRDRFGLAVTAAGGFRLTVDREGEKAYREVLWQSGKEAFHFDSRRGEFKPVDSLPAAIAALIGEGGLDALAVPAFLAGSRDALSDPDAAAVDGSEPCGGSTCWVVSISRMAGAVESRLWIDERTLLVRQVEVRLHAAGDVIDQAVAGAGMAPRRMAGDASTRILVRHEIVAPGEPVRTADLTFLPPSGTARVEPWSRQVGRDLPEFGEEITVALQTVVVRVVDSHGRPVLGLEPGDFRVQAKGREVPVVAVDWVSTSEPEQGRAVETRLPPAWEGEREVPSAGKLVVFFVQSDLHPTRLKGQMRLRPHTRELLDTFPAADRIAVVSFDSHLKLRQDFTDDREAVHRAIDQAMLFGGDRRTVARPSRDPAMLAAHFDFNAALKVASPERALQVTAEALQTLAGEKVLVYLGYGLGRYKAGFGVQMTPDYKPAIRALDAARVTVFVLDVTDADYHSLEVGLQSVAAATGGTYSKTHIFPQQATDILAGTLSGHYVLTLDRSALPAGAGTVRVKLREKKGTVYARPLAPAAAGGR
jgi:VWFA-related protein